MPTIGIAAYSIPMAGTQHGQSLLKVKDLKHGYGQTEILHGLNLSLNIGERIAIMGPSGSGKSTLLNCLGGIDRPRSGTIQFDGLDLTKLSAEELAEFRRQRISTIFQFFHLLPTLSVFENIEFPLQLQGAGAEERIEKTRKLIEEVGLGHRDQAFPDQLSGGEMQRAAIARALVHRPKLILADEPTGNLDTRTGEEILNLLERLTGEHQTALVLVTHSESAARICHRTEHFRDGRLSPSKTVDDPVTT